MSQYVQQVTDHIRHQLHQAVVGQNAVIDQILTGLYAEGHVLIEGVPGTAKTLLVKLLGMILGAGFNRIQFTPDLMPADVTGTHIYNLNTGVFTLRQGPIFTDLLLADEINRTPPKTQAALLEAMEERQTTIDGERHPLSPLFMVFATQNPIEYEGTYPLPEAQLDRFLLQIDVTYPDEKDERKIIMETTGTTSARPPVVFTPEKLMAAQDLVRSMPVGEKTVDAIIALVRACRPETSPLETIRQHVAWGPGPRAGQALMLAVRARALLDGRPAPSLDDVEALALPALGHRMALKHTARANQLNVATTIRQALAAVIG